MDKGTKHLLDTYLRCTKGLGIKPDRDVVFEILTLHKRITCEVNVEYVAKYGRLWRTFIGAGINL